MAQYLIVREDDDGTFVREVEARNVKEAARLLAGDMLEPGFTARVWRVAGTPRTIVLRVETSVSVEVSDAGEDQ